MSSPINDKSFEDRLKYAPPWARRPSPKDNVEARPAEAPKETLPEPERVAPPRNLDPPAAGRLAIAPGPTTAPGAPDQPSTWLRAPARGFEGDRAMRELRTRMTLDPQLVPEPPQPASRGPALKRVVRLLAITGFAAGAAYLVVLFAFPDAKQTALSARSRRHVTLDSEEIASLVKRGQDFIANGDLASARLVLRRAADAGDAQAALLLGSTYDPVIFKQLKVIGSAPDPAQARAWYQRAVELGSTEAVRRLEPLAQGTR